MGQMAERKSPAKSLRERDARDFQPEKYRFDDEKASPSAAEAVGAVLWRLTASATTLVPTTEMTLTSWLADITR